MQLDARIAVIGAGPGGISIAWYLRQLGFTRVTVLERAGRVGGLARTVTSEGRSFELGANLVTLAYRRVLAVAREVGATTVPEGDYVALVGPPGAAHLEPITPVVLRGSSLFAFARAAARYTWARLRVSVVVDRPTWSGLAAHPELCVSFAEWLDRHDVAVLAPLFRIPITTMGYGRLEDISAAHALKYMSLPTFLPTVLRGAFAPLKRVIPYPRRFRWGFQRLFEAMSWRLDVRTGVQVRSVRRDATGVTIRFTAPQQSMARLVHHEQEDRFDHVVVACRPTLEQLEELLDLTDAERELFGAVRTYGYCMASTHVEGLAPPEPVIVSVPPRDPGVPSAVVKQYPDSTLTQFYTVLPGASPADAEPVVWAAVDALITELGARKVPEREQWSTFDQWPYFPHVPREAMRAGWYDRFEAAQGRNRTWFAGAIGSFELVEPIFAYSQDLAERMARA